MSVSSINIIGGRLLKIAEFEEGDYGDHECGF
jgi:hypothetical protein